MISYFIDMPTRKWPSRDFPGRHGASFDCDAPKLSSKRRARLCGADLAPYPACTQLIELPLIDTQSKASPISRHVCLIFACRLHLTRPRYHARTTACGHHQAGIPSKAGVYKALIKSEHTKITLARNPRKKIADDKKSYNNGLDTTQINHFYRKSLAIFLGWHVPTVKFSYASSWVLRFYINH